VTQYNNLVSSGSQGSIMYNYVSIKIILFGDSKESSKHWEKGLRWTSTVGFQWISCEHMKIFLNKTFWKNLQVSLIKCNTVRPDVF
jgi:hypothetical protein